MAMKKFHSTPSRNDFRPPSYLHVGGDGGIVREIEGQWGIAVGGTVGEGELRTAETDVDEHVRRLKGDDYEERNYPTSTMFWMSVRGQSRPVLQSMGTLLLP